MIKEKFFIRRYNAFKIPQKESQIKDFIGIRGLKDLKGQ
jgi:hypothetical protein